MASNSMLQQSANPLIARARSTRAAAAHARVPFESSASNISLFVTNLRLLDLDRRSDWPEISALTFAAKDTGQGQKRRIQCVEWALYQLFILFDAEEARLKLQPFFPPLDQLQSTNLRAALLRSLERLKKNGVLGRDAAIRKTMLDECKGEKLEEMLAVFSSTVLKKRVSEQQLHGSAHAAIAQTLALEDRGFNSERCELGVLILAHKVSLRRKLDQQAVSKAQYKELEDIFNTRQQDLEERWHRLKANGEKMHSTNPSGKEKSRIRHVLRNNWSGNEQWQEAVLYGDSRSQRDGVLSAPFDRVWRRTRSSRLAELQAQHGGLVGQLESRVRAQQERLDKWQKLGISMFGNSSDSYPSRDTSAPMHHQKGISLAFGMHEALVTGSLGSQEVPGASKFYVRGEYADLLRDIETELADSARVPTPGMAALISGRRQATSTSRQTSASAVPMSGLRTAEEPLSELSDLEMESAEPSDSASLRKPASSDAELIQSQRRPMLRTATLHDIQPEFPLEAASSARTQVSSQRHGTAISPQRHSHANDMPEDSQASGPLRTRSPEPSPRLPPPAAYEDALTQSTEQVPCSPKQQRADEILAFMDEASPSPIKQLRQRHTLSLEERTRLSLGRFEDETLDQEGHIDFGSTKRPSTHTTSSKEAEKGKTKGQARSLEDAPAQPIQIGTAESTGDNDLVARTRRSMANFESAQQKAKLERRRSERIAARQQSGSLARQSYFAPTEEDGGPPGDGSSAIVLEELIAKEQGADYDSIFKSRPKIKSSPPSTPIHGAYEWD